MGSHHQALLEAVVQLSYAHTLSLLLTLPTQYAEWGLCNGMVSVRLSVPVWTHSSKAAQKQRQANAGSATLSAYVDS